MTHVLHLAWTDMKALRWPLAGWLALLTADAVLFYIGPPVPPPNARLTGYSIYSIPRMLMQIAPGTIAGLLVQRDSLAGGTGFWQTRPVSRTALLTSKLLSLFVWIVAPPAAVSIPTLLALGIPLNEALGGALTILGGQVSVAIIGSALGAVTPGFFAFAAASICWQVVLNLFNSAIAPGLRTLVPALTVPMSFERGPAVWAILFLPATFTILVYSYFTRDIRRARVGLVAVVIIAASLYGLLDWDAGRRLATAPIADAGGRPELANLQIDGRIELGKPTGPGGRRELLLDPSWSGAGQEYEAFPGRIEPEVEFGDGHRERWPASERTVTVEDTADVVRMRVANRIAGAAGIHQVRTGPNQQQVRSSRLVVGSVSAGDADRPSTRPVLIRGRLRLGISRLRVTAVAPLVAGTKTHMEQSILEVERIQPLPLGAVVQQRRTGKGRWFIFQVAGPGAYSVLRNRDADQAVVLLPRAGSFNGTLPNMGGMSTERFAETTTIASPLDPEIRVEPAWLAHAELVRLASEYLGRMTLNVTIPVAQPEMRAKR